MDFHDELKLSIYKYLKFTYEITKKHPRDELYGVVSQFRRASLSVMLNYI